MTTEFNMTEFYNKLTEPTKPVYTIICQECNKSFLAYHRLFNFLYCVEHEELKDIIKVEQLKES